MYFVVMMIKSVLWILQSNAPFRYVSIVEENIMMDSPRQALAELLHPQDPTNWLAA